MFDTVSNPDDWAQKLNEFIKNLEPYSLRHQKKATDDNAQEEDTHTSHNAG